MKAHSHPGRSMGVGHLSPPMAMKRRGAPAGAGRPSLTLPALIGATIACEALSTTRSWWEARSLAWDRAILTGDGSFPSQASASGADRDPNGTPEGCAGSGVVRGQTL